MKTKKIYSTLLCYVMLAAFVGIISAGVTAGAALHPQKVVVASDQKSLNAEINFLLEEENDTEIQVSAPFLLQPWVLFNILMLIVFHTVFNRFVRYRRTTATFKNPLFITLRTSDYSL